MTDKLRRSAEKILEQGGDCAGVLCVDCSFLKDRCCSVSMVKRVRAAGKILESSPKPASLAEQIRIQKLEVKNAARKLSVLQKQLNGKGTGDGISLALVEALNLLSVGIHEWKPTDDPRVFLFNCQSFAHDGVIPAFAEIQRRTPNGQAWFQLGHAPNPEKITFRISRQYSPESVLRSLKFPPPPPPAKILWESRIVPDTPVAIDYRIPGGPFSSSSRSYIFKPKTDYILRVENGLFTMKETQN